MSERLTDEQEELLALRARKTPATTALVNLSKALLDDANAECAELRTLLVECRDELDRLFFNQAGEGTADLIERLNAAIAQPAALKDAPQ